MYLSLRSTEKMTDYRIVTETISSSLEVAGETISAKLLISIILKGWHGNYE